MNVPPNIIPENRVRTAPEDILYHVFSQVMIYSVELILFEEGCKLFCGAAGFQVASSGFSMTNRLKKSSPAGAMMPEAFMAVPLGPNALGGIAK